MVISVVKRGSFGWLLVWLKRGSFGWLLGCGLGNYWQFWVVIRVVKKR